MRRIIKSAPPARLVTYVKQVGASFKDMDPEIRQDLESKLLQDQNNLCAYCQQKIKSPLKIEHHCEQSICNGENGTDDRRLDYNNLFAVCWGNEGSNHETICDKRKSEIASNPISKNRDLPIDLIPTNPNHIAGIAYSSTGLIRSSNIRHDREINIVLNLNEKNLKEKRKKNWARIISQCTQNGRINVEKLNRLIDNNPDEEFPAMYVHMRNVFSS